jgi:VWFA-related protein
MKRTIFCAGLILSVLALPGLFTAAAGSSDQQAALSQRPIEHQVTVTLKLIQVYVTDRKGNAVTDLGKDDFAVLDNGESKALTEFERHILPPAAGTAAAPPAPVPAAEAKAKPELPRKFLLFFDFGFNNDRGVRKAREAALHFLDAGLRPDDEVGLISYSLTRGLSFNEFLTVEHAKVRQAVEDLGVKPIAGRAEDIEQEYWRRAGETIEPPTDAPAHNEEHPHSWVNPTLDWRREESKNIARNYILKLTALAKALRYVPGRKNIVFFSTGIASSAIYGNAEGTPFGEQAGVGYKFDAGDHVLKTLNEELLHELATSSCSIYSFDTREAAKVPTLFDYDNETFNARNRDIFNTYGPQQNTNLTYKDEPVTGLYSLTKLAKDTGGQYFANINQYGHNLESVETMTGTYYVLGYPIVDVWDGEFHQLKVSVKRPGCEVRAQTGYFNPRPFSEISPLEKQLQLIDLALSENPVFQTPLSAGLQVFPGTDADRTTQFLLRLPVETIDRLSAGRSEIITFVFDPQDAIIDLRRTEEDLSRFREKPVFYSSRLPLAPGTYKCRMIVRNLETGAAAVASAPTFVPGRPTQAETLKLLTPLLLSQPGGAVYLEARSKLSATGGASTGIAVSPYPFDAGNFTPLFGPIPTGRPSIRAVLPCLTAGVPIEDIALRAALIDGATGARANLPILPLEHKAEGDVVYFPLVLDTGDLRPGAYVLYFYAEAVEAHALSFTTAALKVR